VTSTTTEALKGRILEALKRFKSRALHVGEIRGRIGLDKSEYELLVRTMETMAEEGLVKQLPGGRFRLDKKGPRRDGTAAPGGSKAAKTAKTSRGRSKGAGATTDDKGGSTRTGTLTINARGFGFVATDEEGADVFVPAVGLSTAMHGDRVTVRVRVGPKGLDGRVVEIVERRVRYVGGQLHVTASGAFIEPDDDRIRVPIHVRGKPPETARTGQGVIAEVVHHPLHVNDRIEVKIVETFDPKEFVAFETRRVLLREGAAEDFSEDTMAEASALPSSVPQRDKRDRTDLRDLDLVTVDPDDAKDHDDAVWAQELPDGDFRVVVAIADVSHYVPEDSALDRDARERSCTIYLPGRAIPMLPHEISSNLASLVPKRDRLALAVDAVVGKNGAVRSYQLLEAVIRSRARLTYAGAAQALGLTTDGPDQAAAQEHLPVLKSLLQVSKLLGRQRRRRGSLDFDLPEAKVKLDEDTGNPVDVVRSREDPGLRATYKMIEETALLANEIVAQELSKRNVKTIYRVHPLPDLERLMAFSELAKSLGMEIDAEAAQDPKQLQRFLSGVSGTKHAETLSYLLLRAMQQATYSTENVGHFGLAAKEYLHFTSPIRRYPDLVVHRQVRRIARGETVARRGDGEEFAAIAELTSLNERRAMLIEREVVDLHRAMLMQNRVGEEFDARISGIGDYGLFTTIESPFVDAMVRSAVLPRDRYELDPFGIRLAGMYTGRLYSLGDKLRIRIEDVSLARRRISAVLVEDEAPTRGKPRGEAESEGGEGAPTQRKRKRLGKTEGKARDRERKARSKDRGRKKKVSKRSDKTRRR